MILLNSDTSLQQFFSEYQEVCIMLAGCVMIIVLIIIFLGIRVKMRNQERVMRAAKIQEEKYRILAEISNDILFDYDIFADEMVYSEKYTENFGRKNRISQRHPHRQGGRGAWHRHHRLRIDRGLVI